MGLFSGKKGVILGVANDHSIAAAIVGGAAFTGGRGGLLGTMAGVLIVQFLTSMTIFFGLEVEAQLIVKGVVIIGAVALYSVASRK